MTKYNIELYYAFASNVYFILGQFITGICLTVLYREFSKVKKCIFLTGGAYFLVSLGLYYMPKVIGNFSAYFISLFAAFLVMLYLDRRNIRMKIYLTATFFVVRWLSVSMPDKLILLISNGIQSIVDRKVYLSEPAMWRYSFQEFFVTSMFECILDGFILLVMVKGISRAFVYKNHELEIRELLVLLVPSVNGMICYEIFRLYADIFQKEAGTSLFFSYPAIQVLWIFGYIVMLAAIITTITLYQNLKQKQEEEKSRFILEHQVKDMQNHIAEVELLYSDIRGVKHDIKNHISVMKSLLEQENYREAIEYLTPLEQTTETFDFAVKTGNPITDVIIHEKMREAAQSGFTFNVDFHYPADTVIHAFDISVILNNGLSNAIESASPPGIISLYSFRNKNAYLITIENTFDGTLVLDGEDQIPKTSKGNKEVHGFGMRNMKAVAEKYFGDVCIEQEDGNVKLTVMLMTES